LIGVEKGFSTRRFNVERVGGLADLEVVQAVARGRIPRRSRRPSTGGQAASGTRRRDQ